MLAEMVSSSVEWKACSLAARLVGLRAKYLAASTVYRMDNHTAVELAPAVVLPSELSSENVLAVWSVLKMGELMGVLSDGMQETAWVVLMVIHEDIEREILKVGSLVDQMDNKWVVL